jgi:hypothetical protein
MPRGNVFVLVTGPPGSGKTTLAGPLAERLSLPLIAKDTIKEALMKTFLDSWLPAFEADGIRVGVNWSGARATGYAIEPSSIRTALVVALEHLASGNT